MPTPGIFAISGAGQETLRKWGERFSSGKVIKVFSRKDLGKAKSCHFRIYTLGPASGTYYPAGPFFCARQFGGIMEPGRSGRIVKKLCLSVKIA